MCSRQVVGKVDWPWNRFFLFILFSVQRKKQFPALYNAMQATTVEQQQQQQHDEGLMWVQSVIYEPTSMRFALLCFFFSPSAL